MLRLTEGPSPDVSLAGLDILLTAASSFLEAGGERGPQGTRRNWARSLTYVQSGSEEKLAAPFLSSGLRFPCPPAPALVLRAAVAAALLRSPPGPLCPFLSPKLPLVLRRLGGSCLWTPLAAVLGVLCSGAAGWSPSLGRTCSQPGLIFDNAFFVVVLYLETFFE